MSINHEIVERKISLILQDLEQLREMAKLDLPEYLADFRNEILAERYLERIISPRKVDKASTSKINRNPCVQPAVARSANRTFSLEILPIQHKNVPGGRVDVDLVSEQKEGAVPVNALL